ncbi:hypothetical protein DCCM_0582 [Desulfocucumis palustris]|uniref:Uncharacterized protein n=1 Tax=Desulfocucumis palustris TaxID=1898651 RepID=A0A2L2X8F8_9FIRM|nr:hypothetical protein DCCM_0582 [Desulfocucumis palustris]
MALARRCSRWREDCSCINVNFFIKNCNDLRHSLYLRAVNALADS